MVGICSYGAYVPLYRLTREEMGKLMGTGGAGERSVAGADEDTLTVAVDAILDCTKGIDRGSINGLINASCSSPFAEKQLAAVAARLVGMLGAVSSFELMTANPVSAAEGVIAVTKTRKGEMPVTRANIKSEYNIFVLILCTLTPIKSKLSFLGEASKASARRPEG